MIHEAPSFIYGSLANEVVFAEGDGIRQTHFSADRDFSHICAIDAQATDGWDAL